MKEAKEAKARRHSGERRKPTRVRLSDYAAEWVDAYQGRTSRGFSESTRSVYKRDVDNLIVPFLGPCWLNDVDAGDVRDWFRWMEERGVSVSGIRKAKAALGAMYATAVEERKAMFNPVRGVRYVPARDVPLPKKKRPLTMAELAKVRKALEPEWRLLFALLAHTGIRIGELLGLRWGSIHLGDDPCIEIVEQVYAGERKGLKTGNAYRTLPLSAGMARALSDWRTRTEYPDDVSPVFATTAGTAYSYSNLWNRVWQPARDAAGIPGDEVGAFHAFRRTLGSLIHDQGAKTDRQLSDWLGHHDPAFTVREYVGKMDGGLGSAEFLDELVPVDEWVSTDVQHTTPKQPQSGAATNGSTAHEHAAESDQPQTAGSP
jgi:integrase